MPTDPLQVCTTVFTPLEYGVCGLSEEDALHQYGEEDIEVRRHKTPRHLHSTSPSRSLQHLNTLPRCITRTSGPWSGP